MNQEQINYEHLIRLTMLDFHNNIFPKYIKNYKTYIGYVMDSRNSQLSSWRTNANYPMVQSSIDTIFSSIFDFGYNFGVTDEGLKKLCIKSFDFRGAGKIMLRQTLKEALICGKAYIKDSYIIEEDSIEVQGYKFNSDIKQPSVDALSLFDVFYDRTRSINESSFYFTRRFLHRDQIKKIVLALERYEQATDEKKTNITSSFNKLVPENKDEDYQDNSFSFYNYNPVKDLITLMNIKDDRINKTSSNIPYCTKTQDLRGSGSDSKALNIYLNPNKKTHEFIDFISGDKRLIYVNGLLIHEGKRDPRIGKIHEFIMGEIPHTSHAMGVADTQQDLQDIVNALTNAYFDDVKLKTANMHLATGNFPVGPTGRIEVDQGRVLQAPNGASLRKIELGGTTDFQVTNLLGIIEQQAAKATGVNTLVLGSQGAVERTQAGVDLKFSQYKSRLTPLIDSIDLAMGNIARSWIYFAIKALNDSELLEYGIEIKKQYDQKGSITGLFINGIRIQDILDESSISFSYNSMEKITNEGIRANIMSQLQYILQYAQGSINMEELPKIFTGQAFNSAKLFSPIRKENATENNAQSMQNAEPQEENNIMNQLNNII